MAKYIFQLRRGTKYVDENGATLLNPDGTPVRDDWATYTNKDDHLNPLEGELVLEYEVVNGTGKKTPRLKIGDGVSTFADLEYMSVDSFIFPTPTKITLYGGDKYWIQIPGHEDRYVQDISDQLAGKVTVHSKVDLQPTPEQLYEFQAKDVTFTTINEGGKVRVCVIGEMPKNNYENIQVTITEVVANG